VIFFPYKLDISLYRIPFLTILVCLICLVTFLSQEKSETAFAKNIVNYCTTELDANLRAIIENIDDPRVGKGCANIFMEIREAKNPELRIAELASHVRGLEFYREREQDLRYKSDKLARGYSDFQILVPKQLTDNLAYNPNERNFQRMISSTFAHASWGHLLGNLFFFFIFASCVESALGSIHFSLAIILMAISTSLAYSYNVPAGGALPTIGLSGVAMGMMALLTALLPRAQIWCFLWFLFFVRRFTLPVLLIAVWYVGWDAYDLLHNDGSEHINYMAHVSGAITGVVLGLLYRVFSPQRLESLSAGMG
jgi:membrane associated rhomboid family serine protease